MNMQRKFGVESEGRTRMHKGAIAVDSLARYTSGLLEVIFGCKTTYNLKSDEPIPFVAGNFLDMAVSGNGTLYVLYETNQKCNLAVVDSSNGLVLRHVSLFDYDTAYGRIFALNNRLVFIPWQKKAVYAHIYDNEKFTRAIHLKGVNSQSSVFFIATSDYLMTAKRNQITLKNLSDTNAKDRTFKLIDMGDITTLAWVSPDSSNPTFGHLFASSNHPIYYRNEFDSKVYELDLTSVKSGARLKPLEGPFLISEGFEWFEFVHGLNNHSVLC